MKLILINHKEEYAAREIIAAYIPRIKFEITDIVPEDDDYAISSVKKIGEKFKYKAVLSIDGKKYEGNAISCEFSKTFVKRTLAQALKQATKAHLPWGLITGIRPSKMVRELMEKGVEQREILSRFENLFMCDNDKANLAFEVARREMALIGSIPENSVSLYIGIPFCPTRCLYCSFTSQSVEFSNKLTEPYMDALCKEMKATAKIISDKNLKIDTVYIGGGTPTSLSAKQLYRLLDEMVTDFDLSAVREITLEAGRPDTTDAEKLKIISDFKIPRISINPQSMNEKTLETIGRRHSPEDIIKTFEKARKIGFNHINADIIAGLPGETPEDFNHTLCEIEKLNPESVTVHTMSVKRGSFLDKYYDMYTPSAAETVNEMLKTASAKMEEMKKLPYYMYRQKNMLGNLENVGYCNNEHECLYNIYIMEEVQSIFAVGAGASTKIISPSRSADLGDKIDRIFNVKEVSEYIKRIDEMIARKNILYEF